MEGLCRKGGYVSMAGNTRGRREDGRVGIGGYAGNI